MAAGIDLLQRVLACQQPDMPVVPARTAVFWISAVLIFVASRYKAPTWLKPIALIGLVSYPMYLLHQDLGLMFLNWVNVPYSDELYPRLFRLIAMPTLVCAAGAFVFYAVEKPLIEPLTRFLRPLFRWPLQRFRPRYEEAPRSLATSNDSQA
jgi:peptidoglycan/LPS O-acetylase OafA/YrhL